MTAVGWIWLTATILLCGLCLLGLYAGRWTLAGQAALAWVVLTSLLFVDVDALTRLGDRLADAGPLLPGVLLIVMLCAAFWLLIDVAALIGRRLRMFYRDRPSRRMPR